MVEVTILLPKEVGKSEFFQSAGDFAKKSFRISLPSLFVTTSNIAFAKKRSDKLLDLF